ncbi:MAG: T9SS type A sorting domain-containing protein [Bacteroidota bacterium]
MRYFFFWIILFPPLVSAQNTNLSQSRIFDGEPFIAVNPSDAQHMVVAWMGFEPGQQFVIHTRATFDAGKTWSGPVLIPHEKLGYSSPDPCLAFGPQGRVHLSYIDFNPGIDSGEVYVRTTVDGGLSWGPAAFVIGMRSDPGSKPIDRPWMVVDRSGGPNDGNVYVTTMNLAFGGGVPPPYHVYITRSTDGGASFQPWRYLDSANFEVGSILAAPMPTPAMSSTGMLQIVYPTYVLRASRFPRYILATSTDGGLGFSYREILEYREGTPDSLSKKGYLLRVNPANDQHLVFCYLGAPNGDTDVFLRESLDGGLTWSNAMRVNDDPALVPRVQDMIWADFDLDGDLVVVWRDRRTGMGNTYEAASETWAAVKRKNQPSFEPNFRVSDALIPYDSVLTSAGNDFMCVKLMNDTLNAVWGDTRDGNINIWFQRMGLDGTVMSRQQLGRGSLPSVKVYPNPAQEEVTVSGIHLKHIHLMDLSGKLVLEKKLVNQPNEFSLLLANISPGMYQIVVEDKLGKVVQKLEIK